MSADQLDRNRLVKLAGMFGSDHAGERANAAALADELVRQAGLRWPDLILPALPSPTRGGRTVEDAIEAALACEGALNAWEAGFVRSLKRQKTPISVKQLTILSQITEKLRAAWARAA